MQRYGSCNAQAFSIHPGGVCSGLVGTALTSPKALDVWARKNTVTDINLFRATAPGQQWGWSYEFLIVNPMIRVIRNSDDSILYAWEAESDCDPSRPAYYPIPQTDDYGVSILPADGSAVWAGWPTAADFDTLQGLVEAASLPSWITGTDWSGAADCEELLRRLFRAEESRCGLTMVNTIADALNRLLTTQEYYLYMLIWLRCASRILYGHYGQTCIPLLLDKFSVDSSGVVSL